MKLFIINVDLEIFSFFPLTKLLIQGQKPQFNLAVSLNWDDQATNL